MFRDEEKPTELSNNVLETIGGGLFAGASGTGKTLTAELLGKYSRSASLDPRMTRRSGDSGV